MGRTVLSISLAASLLAACGSQAPFVLRQAQDDKATQSTVRPVDTTSILKKLTKDVEIGSTVDPSNGDTGPRSLSMALKSFGEVKKGDLLVCNFADSSGNAGKGTTVELLASTVGSKPKTFLQSSDIEGCDGAAVVPGDAVYVCGLTSKECVTGGPGRLEKVYGGPGADPLTDGFGPQPPGYNGLYSPYFIFVGDALKGSVVNYSLGGYGTGLQTEVILGFAVNKAKGWSALGPAGLAYDNKVTKQSSGTLYVTDGVSDTLVEVYNAPNLLVKDEIIVKKDGKTFTCRDPKSTCAKLVLAGPPLNKPFGATVLPNGNLIVANTGTNSLVEVTPTGQVLDTKTIDTGSAPAIFALWAKGTNDNNTVLYYTDTNSNTVQELEQ